MGIYGQDWSGYQDASPSTTGLSFAFTKVTEGLTYTNPHWVTQRSAAKDAGLVWGAYHYPHMANDVQAEADFFLSKVAFKSGDLVVLDWEGYDSANSGVSKTTQKAYKESWLRYVKGKLPNNPVGMYCNVDYWKNVDTTGYYGDFLWIATAGRDAGSPGITAPWLFHQYSTAGGLDRDYSHLTSKAALSTWALSFDTSEDDVTLTKADVFDAVWNTDKVKAPADSPELATNPTWSPQSFLKDVDARIRALQVTAAAQGATITTLVDTVAKLATAEATLDPVALVAEIKAAIEKVTINLDVSA